MGYIAKSITAEGVAGIIPIFEWNAAIDNNYNVKAGTWAKATLNTLWIGAKVHNETGAGANDEIALGNFSVPLDSDYVISLIFHRDTDMGKAHIMLNGVDKGEVELYGAYNLNIVGTATLSALTKGQYIISIKIVDKHGSSSGYRCYLQSALIIKA